MVSHGFTWFPSMPNALLAHEVWDDTVKCRALEVQRLSGLTHALLASAKAAKVLLAVFGATSERSSMMILPAAVPPIVMSK